MTKTNEPTIADQIIQLVEHFNLGWWAIGAVSFGGLLFVAFLVFWIRQWRKITREGDEIRSRIRDGWGMR